MFLYYFIIVIIFRAGPRYGIHPFVFLMMGLSHFLPEGGAEFASSPAEKIYFVLEGEVTVKTETEEITLGPWDSVFIGPDEGRSIINNTNKKQINKFYSRNYN